MFESFWTDQDCRLNSYVCVCWSLNFVSVLKKTFDVNPTSTRVEIGHQMELRCVPPAGVPPPRIYWLRDGQQLLSDTDVLVSSEGHLLIGQARPQDTGNYTCVAENIAAKRTATPAQITVFGKWRISIYWVQVSRHLTDLNMQFTSVCVLWNHKTAVFYVVVVEVLCG